jgi:Butirosin biosynthesis protein H, N-terminal/Domain of unknown function (DUF4872)
MTAQKSLKNLVRQRMSHTGESYTTAYRRVTAHRPAAPVPGVVPGYPAFGAEQHQPSALVRHLLAQAGLELTEPMVCGLGGGIGFLYAVFEYKTVPYPLLTIVAQHHPQPWFEAVTGHLAIAATTVTSASARTALTKLDAAVDAGHPALIVVGRGLMPGHDNISELEAADAYPVVVAGRIGGEYLIDDRADAPWRMDRAGLGEAWAAHRKGRFALTTVTPPLGPVDQSAAIRAALITTTDHLTGPVLGNYFDVNMGLSGMTKFAAELRDRTTKTGWARRFSSPLAVEMGLRRVAECLTWQHTAPGGTRPLYAQFLAEAANATGLDLLPASRSAALAGENWTLIADLAGSADPDDDPPAVFAAIADLVDAAFDAETLLVQQIRAAQAAGHDDGDGDGNAG